MKQFKFYILIAIAILFSSCSSLKEGFTNQKKNNSDEFLVEKKSPLVLPPDYNELPIPNEENINKQSNEIK
jgi:PBP1b-binding outer membrane lipoprotein LpoB